MIIDIHGREKEIQRNKRQRTCVGEKERSTDGKKFKKNNKIRRRMV